MSGTGLAANLPAREFPERLLVQVASARSVSPRNSDGESSDPYCVVCYGDKKEKTKTVQKTLNPQWNESFVFVVDPRILSLKVEIFDLGTLRDEHMGEVVIDLKPILIGRDALTLHRKGSSKKPVSGDIQVSLCASSIAELLRKDANTTPAEELVLDLKTLENRFIGSGFDTHLVSSRLRIGKASFTYPGRVAVSQHIAHTIPSEYMPIGSEKDRKAVTIMLWIYPLAIPPDTSSVFRCAHDGQFSAYLFQRGLQWWSDAGGGAHLLPVLQVGRWTHLAVTLSATPRVVIDGSTVVTLAASACPDPLSVLRSPLTIGGPPYSRVGAAKGNAIWAFVDGVSIVLGDISVEDIKSSLDSQAPVDVVSSIVSGGVPQDVPILRAVPSVATRFVTYLAQLCNSQNENVKTEAKALATGIATKITALLSSPSSNLRFIPQRSFLPSKESTGVMSMVQHGHHLFIANSKGVLSVYDDNGAQVVSKPLHEGRIHGTIIAAETLWTVAEDCKVIVSRANAAPFPVVCTLKEHTAMIRAIALVTHGEEQRVWTGDVTGVVNLWDPFGLDWEQVGNQATNIPHTPLPVSAKELEGLACICQVKDTVWLGTRKAIIVYDLKTHGVTRTISMAYAPNKLCYVPESGVWCASASPDIQIFDDVGERINSMKGHTAKVLSLYYWASKSILFSGGFDTTIFAWQPSTLSCIAEIKGRHKDGIRSILAPENSDCIWTAGDDKDAGVQVYTTVEQGLELSSFVGPLLPYVLILSREAGVELLERFCQLSKSWDLNTDVCRSSLSMIAPAFQVSVKGGAVYNRWTACYLYLLNKIPANYTAAFYPSVLKDLCTIASSSESLELRKLAIEAMASLGKNKNNREQILNEVAPKGAGSKKILTIISEVADLEARNAIWDFARERLQTVIAVPSTLGRDLAPLLKSSKLADVCFYPEGNKEFPVYAHRVIVSARCKALGQLIAAECASLPPGGVADIRLADVPQPIFKPVIESIYGSDAPELPGSVNSMLKVLLLAKNWGLEDLANFCLAQIRDANKKPADLVEMIVQARQMADGALAKQLTDSCTAELMNCKHSDIQNVDLTSLGQQFLASLFKRLRRKEAPPLANYEPPNMALRFARDFDTLPLEYSDFKIRAGDEVIMSFRCLLYSRSHYFTQMFENGGPQEISVNVSPAVMRVLHSFLISDAPSMGPLNGNLNLVYELLAALEVFRPKNDNCLSAALAHIRELRGEAAPPSAAAKPKAVPPLCRNRHSCQWATLLNTFNCDKCGARSLPGNHHWQCRGCDWDYCTNCVPEAGDPRGTALNGIAGVVPANPNIADIERDLQDLLRDL